MIYTSLIYMLSNKDIYFYKKSLNNHFNGNLTADKKKNVELIIKSFYKYGDGDQNKLSYILATASHESLLLPIREFRASQGSDLYDQQNNYWLTGYYGRGFVQLTWLSNYQKFENILNIPLVSNPDLALNPNYAADILVLGMIQGLFTGRKLSDYINDSKKRLL